MIGYNKDNSNKTFEIHAGYDNEYVHWYFQRHGYPAILVSEDCFVNDPNQDPVLLVTLYIVSACDEVDKDRIAYCLLESESQL